MALGAKLGLNFKAQKLIIMVYIKGALRPQQYAFNSRAIS
jgi:hypothetical protein